MFLGGVHGKEHCVLIGEFRRNLLDGVLGQVFVGLAEVDGAVRIGAIFSKTAHLFILVELTLLSFVVIVRNVQQFELHLDGQ